MNSINTSYYSKKIKIIKQILFHINLMYEDSKSILKSWLDI